MMSELQITWNIAHSIVVLYMTLLICNWNLGMSVRFVVGRESHLQRSEGCSSDKYSTSQIPHEKKTDQVVTTTVTSSPGDHSSARSENEWERTRDSVREEEEGADRLVWSQGSNRPRRSKKQWASLSRTHTQMDSAQNTQHMCNCAVKLYVQCLQVCAHAHWKTHFCEDSYSCKFLQDLIESFTTWLGALNGAVLFFNIEKLWKLSRDASLSIDHVFGCELVHLFNTLNRTETTDWMLCWTYLASLSDLDSSERERDEKCSNLLRRGHVFWF